MMIDVLLLVTGCLGCFDGWMDGILLLSSIVYSVAVGCLSGAVLLVLWKSIVRTGAEVGLDVMLFC